ncbi:M56 family metallopeptidase [Chryseobacterium sp. SIMBA_029]|uniref:M56 family metallopeptidase n=1 Tax=Chryseobacterium sp. SIMBA_029 TaxID=3085772 RepID=UPI00397DAA29
MLAIILKIILCSSIFIGIYYLFLEREKMYRFNRFYLLFSLIFSYVIPFISITIQLPEPKNKSQILFEDTAQQIVLIQHEQDSFNWMNVIWIIYGAITLFFLIRSMLSVRAVKRMQGEKRIYQNRRVMVMKENIPPFSFWNTIYLGEDYIKNNMIDPRIFLHEAGHIEQKHSLDLIFLDIMKIFTWFNPALFLYKKAILTNHEFLADEAVLNNRYNIKEYQNLILNEIINIQNLPLTHSFNFNNTKKRFIMMTAKKSKFIVVKKAAGIMAMIAAVALFAERSYAISPTITKDTHTVSSIVKNSLSIQDPYKEFKDILDKYSDLLNSGKYAEFSKKISASDKSRLEDLYPQLTDAQRNEQKITFINIPELKKRIPTEGELKSFLNKSNYAVWIDSKKIENSSLKNYKTSDFSHVSISGVGKNARTAKNPQPYQVSLMSNNYFEKTMDRKPHTAMGIKKGIVKVISDTISPRKTVSNEGISTNANIQQDKDFVQAEFPEGAKSFRSKVLSMFDTSTLNGKEKLIKSTAFIHIDETGKISQITASGNNEDFNKEIIKTITAVNNGASWKPATKNGKAIASIYNFPATMSFR